MDQLAKDLATYEAAFKKNAAAQKRAAKAAAKAIDARITAAYGAVGNGIQIDIFDIPKIYKLGAAAIADGADDETLKATIAGFLATNRKN